MVVAVEERVVRQLQDPAVKGAFQHRLRLERARCQPRRPSQDDGSPKFKTVASLLQLPSQHGYKQVRIRGGALA